jgi:predicted Zn-dependent peptidase
MHKMVRRTMLCLLGTTVVGCIEPQSFSGRAFQAHFPLPETGDATLPNGVRVFLERDPQSPVVSIGWMVPAGRTSDPPGKSGLAHLTEHLVFQAPRQGATRAIEFYDQSGVAFRGETDSTATRFAVTVNRERFVELLKFELARMDDPLTSLGENDVRREIRMLREEAASQRPRWRVAAMNSLFRALFPEGGSLVLDEDEQHLEGLTIKDVRQFIATHYRPERMQLFIVGDFNWAEAQGTLGLDERPPSTSASPARPAVVLASPPAMRPIEKLIQHRGFVAENVLLIGWPLPAHVDMIGIEPMLVPLVSTVLPRIEGPSQGKYPAWMPQGPLGKKSVDLITTQQGSAIVVTAQLPPKADPAKIAAKIINEVDSLATKISGNPRTFSFVQFKVTQSRLRETEDIDYRLLRLMTQHSRGDLRPSRQYFADLNGVTARQAGGFAGTWLRKTMARVVLISPAEAKDPDDMPVRVPNHKGMMIDPLATAMGPGPKSLFADGKFVWNRLANGVEVAVLSRPKSTINTLLLGVRSTLRNPDLEPIDPFIGVARATLPCPSSVIACEDAVDASSLRTMVSALASNVPEASRYLLEVAAAPRYEWSPGLKDWFGPLLEKQEIMPEAAARRDLAAELWGNHPKGKRLSSGLLRRMTLADLLQWEGANVRPENTLVVAVTNGDPDRLADAIGAQMGRWNVRHGASPLAASPAPDVTKSHPLRILYATDPALESSRFYFGCLMPPLATFTERAAAAMVGDWVDRVLFARLRNQSDASYSTVTRVDAYSSGETSMLGGLDVGMDQVGLGIALFRDLFDRPREFAEPEVNLMKELRRRRVALQNLRGPEIVAEIFDRWSFHIGNPTPLHELDEIGRVTSAQLGAIWDVCRQNAVLQVRTNKRLHVNFEK